MKRLAAGLLAAGILIGVAGPAGAVPPGLAKKGPELGFSCNDVPVEVFGGNGRSFWLADGRRGLLRSFEFSGTFTPLEGPVQTESESKTYGRGPRGATVTCTATFEEVVPGEGTFVGSATVEVVFLR